MSAVERARVWILVLPPEEPRARGDEAERDGELRERKGAEVDLKRVMASWAVTSPGLCIN
jgi:hypothetical protein